jgi:hypothetical protein
VYTNERDSVSHGGELWISLDAGNVEEVVRRSTAADTKPYEGPSARMHLTRNCPQFAVPSQGTNILRLPHLAENNFGNSLPVPLLRKSHKISALSAVPSRNTLLIVIPYIVLSATNTTITTTTTLLSPPFSLFTL